MKFCSTVFERLKGKGFLLFCSYYPRLRGRPDISDKTRFVLDMVVTIKISKSTEWNFFLPVTLPLLQSLLIDPSLLTV
jgi:hypothetical protein